MDATLEEIERKASEYLRRVIDGERIVVYRDGHPVAEIRPMNETEALRPAGLAAGEFVVPDDFDEPLPDDLLNRLRGSMKLLLDSGVWDLCNKGRRARAADLELAQLRAWVPSALDRSKADAHADRATRRTILG